jgi:cytochrome c-type biogenesis protein CcmE
VAVDVTDPVDDDRIGEGGDGGLDVTPRSTGPAPAAGRRARRWLAPVLVVGLVAAAGGVVFQLLSSATTYYCNADEIGTKSGCETGRRFRLLGQVDQGSIVAGTPFRFTVSHNGRTVPVSYEGEPAGKFQACVPVLVEGRMVGQTFEGDRILVRHTEEYVEQNPDRVGGYDAMGACSVTGPDA